MQCHAQCQRAVYGFSPRPILGAVLQSGTKRHTGTTQGRPSQSVVSEFPFFSDSRAEGRLDGDFALRVQGSGPDLQAFVDALRTGLGAAFRLDFAGVNGTVFESQDL